MGDSGQVVVQPPLWRSKIRANMSPLSNLHRRCPVPTFKTTRAKLIISEQKCVLSVDCLVAMVRPGPLSLASQTTSHESVYKDSGFKWSLTSQIYTPMQIFTTLRKIIFAEKK